MVNWNRIKKYAKRTGKVAFIAGISLASFYLGYQANNTLTIHQVKNNKFVGTTWSGKQTPYIKNPGSTNQIWQNAEKIYKNKLNELNQAKTNKLEQLTNQMEFIQRTEIKNKYLEELRKLNEEMIPKMNIY